MACLTRGRAASSSAADGRAEKAAGLVACGARVTVVSPELDESFARSVEWRAPLPPRRPARHVPRDRRDLRPRSTSACTATPRRAGCSATSPTCPELCNFILPAVHREGPITVAVSTGGASPALAKRLRSQIAALVGPEHATLAARARGAAPGGQGSLRHLRRAARLLRSARHGAARVTVYLVGAGPGDPGLITVRGLELIRTLRRARLRRARRARAGRRGARRRAAASRARASTRRSSTSCSSSSAATGLEVVRLKGGDPFIFGRGGEEALALAEAGIPFEVVPGVSALSAVPGLGRHPGHPSRRLGAGDARQRPLGEGRRARLRAAWRRRPGTLVVFMGARPSRRDRRPA